MTRQQDDREVVTPFITAALADRDRRAADPGDDSPWPQWTPQPDMLPPAGLRVTGSLPR